MNSLVVASHSDSNSLTHHIARATVDALRAAGGTVEFADLAAEQFDPRFSEGDLHLYRGSGRTPNEVVAEQNRIDRAEHLILVFPVYWWSFPALLKGWIDRVFVNGWAYHYTPGGAFEKKLGRLTVHLVPVAGDDAASFARHGIDSAFRSQIERGIIEYCGATVGATRILHESETKSAEDLGVDVRELVADLVARVGDAEGALPRSSGSVR
ncbi:NAD(P)H-dependent oxidoreductase [Rhodococcoides yunnanense]|uniref:NAD(P)H-dependent oxidoreductase n=1 Tax=Rhodococcoides yunnanense TaxID=278209 RepID=UPI0009334DA0|nr:NAD(P)H-dependent oxidoreductase [Rhodococcus yunnanensis]